MRTTIQDEGLMKKLNVVATLAGLNNSTPKGWFFGDVRDPRHSSVMACMMGLGYESTWKKKNGKWDLEKELELAKAWLKAERAKKAKTKKKKGT